MKKAVTTEQQAIKLYAYYFQSVDVCLQPSFLLVCMFCGSKTRNHFISGYMK